jgi:hypothetical protein
MIGAAAAEPLVVGGLPIAFAINGVSFAASQLP